MAKELWFEHVHIISPDPMKLAAFYEKAFGAKITRTGTLPIPGGGVSVSLDLGGKRLAIMVPDTPDKRDPPDIPYKHFGLEHIALGTDDIEGALKRAVAAGATLIRDVLPTGPKFAYVMAPENTMIEFVEKKRPQIQV